MRQLYLVRHAAPHISPDVAPRDWPLSGRGADEARALASVAESWGIEALYSSSEAKASGTALIIGDALGLTPHVVDAFDELRMPEWIANSDDFQESVRAILEGADPLPRGAESAAAAAARFASGVAIVEQGAFPAAVVSHGRILTAYLAQFLRLEDPYAVWRAIPMPGWACIDLDHPRIGFVVPFST